MSATPPPGLSVKANTSSAISPLSAVAHGTTVPTAPRPAAFTSSGAQQEAPPNGGAQPGSPREAQLMCLREVRAEAQDLLAALDSVRRGETTVKAYAAYVRRTTADIGALLVEVTARSDEIRHLRNAWEQMEVNPLIASPEADYTAQEQLHYLDMLAAQIRRLVYYVGYETIPTRLNEWLDGARPGYYVPFHLVFEDEMPEREDRVRILNYLAYSPEAIRGGLVDAPNGLIYRFAAAGSARLWSLVKIALILLLCTGVVVGVCYVSADEWPLTQAHQARMLVGWLAVLAGVVTHVGVGGVKRAQTQGGLPPVIAVGDFTKVVNAREGQIMLKVFTALVGFFGLVFGAGVAQLTIFNAFLVGYSLDSFVELFRGSLEQRATAQVASLKKQLGVEG